MDEEQKNAVLYRLQQIESEVEAIKSLLEDE